MTRLEKIAFVKGLSIQQTAQLLDSTSEAVRRQYEANLKQLQKCFEIAKKSGKRYRGRNAAEWREILTNYQNKLV